LEVLLAFGFGFLTSYWVLAALIALSIWSELSDNHITSATFTVLGLVSAYFIFNLSPLLLLAYIPTGILWSVWRWRVHCKNCLERAKEGTLRETGSWQEVGNKTKEYTRRNLENKVDLKQNVDKVVSWIICFPASVIERCASDLIYVVKSFVTGWFSKVYTASSTSVLKDFDKE